MVINMFWARIENNRVVELTDVDPEGRFPPGIYNWQPCPEETKQNWVADQDAEGNWVFGPYIPPAPTPEEIVERNQNSQRSKLTEAATLMAPVLVSLNLGDSSEEEIVLAKAWQAYYRDLKLVDLTVENPEWPTSPEI